MKRLNQIRQLITGTMLLLALYTLALTDSEEPVAAIIETPNALSCSTNPTNWTCDTELKILTEAIYFEARSEYWTGQEAVAHVIMNRLQHPEFPNNIRDIVYQDSHKPNRCQFSYTCDGRSEKIRDLKAWEDCVVSAKRVYYKQADDNTEGAVFYINKKISNNQAFFETLEPTKKIGSHTFYRIPQNTVASL